MEEDQQSKRRTKTMSLPFFISSKWVYFASGSVGIEIEERALFLYYFVCKMKASFGIGMVVVVMRVGLSLFIGEKGHVRHVTSCWLECVLG